MGDKGSEGQWENKALAEFISGLSDGKQWGATWMHYFTADNLIF